MLNVLFYHANDTINLSISDKEIWLGTAALYLKTHIENNCKDIADKVNWLLPKQRKMSNDALIDYCITNRVDFLCTSHYIWNHSFLLNQLKSIRQMLPGVTFVAGGPSVDVHIAEDFFATHPYIDYAIYGSGEFAFADLISSLLENKKLISFNTSNIAWFDDQKNKTIVANFKYVPQTKVSPFCANEEFFTDMVKEQQQDNINVVLPYDLTRGCPYSCTFCDWNSGLSNKVTRRKETYQQEIDLFQKLGIHNIYLSDANVGQYLEDIDLIEYMAKKNIEEQARFTIDGNLSKLRVENNLKIFHLAAQGNLMNPDWGFMISVQDIDRSVLKNIERPDIGWEKYKEVITELTVTYPHISPVVQMIQGLPGQTVTSWRKSLSEVIKYNVKICVFLSELLPASPAVMDPEYQKNFKFTYSNSERYGGKELFRGTFPESCYSFTKEDQVEMTLLTMIYSSLANLKILNPDAVEHINIEYLIDRFILSPEYTILKENLYNNWCNDKFYFTKNFNGKYDTKISACSSMATSTEWSSDLAFLSFVLKNSGTKYKKILLDIISNNKMEMA